MEIAVHMNENFVGLDGTCFLHSEFGKWGISSDWPYDKLKGESWVFACSIVGRKEKLFVIISDVSILFLTSPLKHQRKY